jgi:glycosyltransferase involved in cell wall biosynthesis
MLTILLTSYNRPYFVQRALDSLQAQTSQDWRCIVLDDNSNDETMDVLAQYTDHRILVIPHLTTDEERGQSSRYAVLINEVLPTLQEGIVGYLCDNVEYAEDTVATVLQWFDAHPEAFAGYVLHQRDAWTVDGQKLGTADVLGHWDFTPDEWRPWAGNVTGHLDHSQVFHRLPCTELWNEDIDTVHWGDGWFFSLLSFAHGNLWPIGTEDGRPLTIEHLFK